ncbi:hypothetical protein [Gordonia rhizosphera]|uniref:Acetyltransferase n=1 Tax=Gordonia rhizosphera NBRC 16068 TaxID=1108045 RepID=K6W0S4_9ACTN|nr:hypothetical protein [Gordonia rhizosphera]GAB92770.1 hypothetical protein GORHZ_191_00290 [Gordonia rhizosphera NBRC 16068]
MTIAVTRLNLDSFESLPAHTRRCVFWEVDPSPAARTTEAAIFGEFDVFESEFDKEAWISALLLEWGTCGQVAVDGQTGHIVGTAFYAPPGRVPRARLFPTSPVSADAVLLTTIHTEPGFDEAAPILLDSVVTDLVRRGVRAIEAFGIVRTPAETMGSGGDQSSHSPSPHAGVTELGALESISSDLAAWSDDAIIEITRAVHDSPQVGLCTECIMDAHFLKDSGFDLVASHARFPRFRLELDEGLGWKHEVEHALEQLVVMAALDLAGRERAAGVPVGRRST